MDFGQNDVVSFRVLIRDTKARDVLTQYQGADADVKAILKLVTSKGSDPLCYRQNVSTWLRQLLALTINTSCVILSNSYKKLTDDSGCCKHTVQ